MAKKPLLAASLLFLALSATAAPAIQCNSAQLQHQATGDQARVSYIVQCGSAAANVATPRIQFSGDFHAQAGAPYKIAADYTLTIQPPGDERVGRAPHAGQVYHGALAARVVSPATLPAQLAAQMHWDAEHQALSIEERPGRWHVFLQDQAGLLLIDAGFASEPVRAGKARLKIDLGAASSRFAGKAPVTIAAQLQVRGDALALMLGETQAEGQADVQQALLSLDKAPKDLSRAWALAARAQYLGLDAEVQYAIKKVAAHHPHQLLEFQKAVDGIAPFSQPNQ